MTLPLPPEIAAAPLPAWACVLGLVQAVIVSALLTVLLLL